jgi:hypothetical protein
MFESSYTCGLLRLGQKDALARRADVLDFFEVADFHAVHLKAS